MTSRSILLTGSTGQIGSELLQSLAMLGEVVAPSRSQMDLSNETSVRETIRNLHPRWIVNAGAYTAVDRAESESQQAYAVNCDAIKVIGEEARQIRAAVIHFSTDYVFDGTGTRAYLEDDATGPINVYGASKRAGEQTLQRSGAAHLIFRTSWVYGSTGKNFLRTILNLAQECDVLQIVEDQHGTPTWSRDIARMTAAVISQCETSAGERPISDVVTSMGGIYHAAGAGETTWHAFAAEAVWLMRKRVPEAKWANLQGISTAEYPTAARRPSNSRLDCRKLADTFNWKMMNWRESLRQVLSEL